MLAQISNHKMERITIVHLRNGHQSPRPETVAAPIVADSSSALASMQMASKMVPSWSSEMVHISPLSSSHLNTFNEGGGEDVYMLTNISYITFYIHLLGTLCYYAKSSENQEGRVTQYRTSVP